MTKEDKKLLLKDLCARLPYGVKIEIPCVFAGKEKLKGLCLDIVDNIVINESGDEVDIEKVLIYLRSMSSMTEDENKEYNKTFCVIRGHGQFYTIDTFDWLNAHHFDYRGLIEKGLALEAPEDMYKF